MKKIIKILFLLGTLFVSCIPCKAAQPSLALKSSFSLSAGTSSLKSWCGLNKGGLLAGSLIAAGGLYYGYKHWNRKVNASNGSEPDQLKSVSDQKANSLAKSVLEESVNESVILLDNNAGMFRNMELYSVIPPVDKICNLLKKCQKDKRGESPFRTFLYTLPSDFRYNKGRVEALFLIAKEFGEDSVMSLVDSMTVWCADHEGYYDHRMKLINSYLVPSFCFFVERGKWDIAVKEFLDPSRYMNGCRGFTGTECATFWFFKDSLNYFINNEDLIHIKMIIEQARKRCRGYYLLKECSVTHALQKKGAAYAAQIKNLF